jgi:type II secretory pathway pseudopilin PulG
MQKIRSKKQGGFTLVETLISAVIAVSIGVYLAGLFKDQAIDSTVDRYGKWMGSYLNALTGYMVQNPVAPAVLVRNGTDWLKPNTCGGGFPEIDSFLSCNVPTNFTSPFGLASPTVTFSYAAGLNPTANVVFGVVQDNGGADSVLASLFVKKINQQVTINQGYQNVDVFAATDNTLAELQSANLRAVIDNNLAADIHLRLDGANSMTAPILSESTTWAMIARDNAGTENILAEDPQSSVNVNDVFNRSSDAWLSETHNLAEEAYALAVRAPQFMSEVVHNTVIQKPNCPGTLSAQIFTDAPIFVGGPNSGDARLISGVRTPVIDQGASWRVQLFTLYEDTPATWQPVPPDMGRVKATVRCS